jgi:uncharacterized LabA/DUF88 family protein
MRTNLYVDGFNLYYGATKGTAYKWLDIATLGSRILGKSGSVNRVRYFTAMVDGARDPDGPMRQQTYIRALQTVPNLTVHLGFFLTKQRPALNANPPPQYVQIIKTEEKGSDVNLASYMLLDAFQKDYDQAVVISNDSDLTEPISIVQSEFGLPVWVVNPHKRPAAELLRVATFYRKIRPGTLAKSQFPATLTDARGTFSKPAPW